MELFMNNIFTDFFPFWVFILILFGYSWTTWVDNVDDVMAAHVNNLQDEKLDRDGAIECTGTLQWDKGADVASAPALAVLSDGNYFDVTGTTGITSINASQSQPGTVIKLHFDDAVLITHHGTNLIMPNAANYTTGAGDEIEFIEYEAAKWRCTIITPAAGGASVKNAVTIKTGNYTLLGSDLGRGKVFLMNNAAARTFDLPSVAAGDIGVEVTIGKIGAGKVTIQTVDSDTVHDSSGPGTLYNALAAETYALVRLILITETKWAICGMSGTGWITT